MAILTNNQNIGTGIGELYTGHGVASKFFTVVVKDASGTAIDLRAHDDASGYFHKDGLVDRVLQIAGTKGTVIYFNVKNDNSGTVTIGLEGEFGTATNLANAYDNDDPDGNVVAVKFRLTKSSTSEDGAADISGTTVAADTLV